MNNKCNTNIFKKKYKWLDLISVISGTHRIFWNSFCSYVLHSYCLENLQRSNKRILPLISLFMQPLSFNQIVQILYTIRVISKL